MIHTVPNSILSVTVCTESWTAYVVFVTDEKQMRYEYIYRGRGNKITSETKLEIKKKITQNHMHRAVDL